jgi:hypothetical protein
MANPADFFAKNAAVLPKLSEDEPDAVDFDFDAPIHNNNNNAPSKKRKAPAAASGGTPLKIGPPKNGEGLQLARANAIERKLKTLRTDILQPQDNSHIGIYILNMDILPKLASKDYFNDMVLREAPVGSGEGVGRGGPLLSEEIRNQDPVAYDTVKNLITESQRQRQLVGQHHHSNQQQQMAECPRRIIPICSRRWNATMLASATGYDRECVCSNTCISLLYYGKKLKEFLTPEDVVEGEKTGKKPAIHKPCLLCVREICHLDYEYNRVNQLPFSDGYRTQPHRNLVDVEGEYLGVDCIPLTHKHAFPMVMNKFDNGYVPIYDENTKLLTILESGYKDSVGAGFYSGVSPQLSPTKKLGIFLPEEKRAANAK